ncbi:MAG: sugar phosphate nucleotidyltransferase [Parachlamydiaceae bacterium]
MKRVFALIMGGGEGSRLFPLTRSKAKPALQVAGKYRLIDFPILNALHSDIQQVYVLTQFLASSLHRHLSKTYGPNVNILACEKRPGNDKWYQGTADAVRQNLENLIDCAADYFLILSGDHIYEMDFREFVNFSIEKGADIAIASLPVSQELAPRMGILSVDADQKIVEFIEKPQHKLSHSPLLGSMGIYCFKREALFDALTTLSGDDFGKEIIPELVRKGKAYAYRYEGYWEDIGTVKSFYEANLALIKKIHLEPKGANISELAGARFHNTTLRNVIVNEGSIIHAKSVQNSILGPRTIVEDETVIDSSYILGNEFYEHPVEKWRPCIGKDCHIRKAIIDENVRIGDHVKLINEDELDRYDSPFLFIRDGVIVVPRGAIIPPHFCI